ncbi:MAG TPA: ABC transporter substrate-binding protein [Anaerolineae bacterium]|nr:ABC transporter substrate-binding protein [Anaerolineae bacterium]
MKRLWFPILLIGLLSLILAACGGAAPTTEQAPTAAPAEEQEEAAAPTEEAAAPTEEEAAAPTEEAAAPTEEEAAAPTEEAAAPTEEAEVAPTEEATAPAEEAEAATEEVVDLAAVCPSPVVIQTDWFPEAEHGALYEMVGDDYVVDTDTKVVRGSLVASGQETGVDIEVRTGGPAIGFQQPIQQMYVESDITLGYVSTNEAVFGAEDTPTLSVIAPLEKNPQIIMWDPETYPEVKTIADLGKTDATIQVFAGGTFIDVFVNEGIVSADQIDPSYDGSPARWVAENGAVAQQGFASAEPYVYQNEIDEWGKPVAFELIHDAGFEIYSQALAIRTADLETLRPCLELLVPIVQQATVDYVTSPDRANAIIVDAVEKYQDFWVYSPELAEYSVNAQIELGLVANGPDDVIGNMDPDRVQGVIDQMTAAGLEVPEGLQASDIITNEFIDESIGLP